MGWSLPSFSRPSTVVISDPSACTANIVHDFTARPFISTVHAPQYVVSQPTCVPVRSQASRRNSTSNMRGSTSRAYDLPFTLMWTLTAILFTVAIAGIPSGIEVGPFDRFSASSAHCNLNGALHQGYDQLTLVLGGSTHVRLRIGGGTGRFCGSGNHLVVQTPSTERCLGLGRADRRQSNAAESNGGILADVARHDELYGSTGTWIHGSTPLKCNIGAAVTLRRNLHFNFGNKFVGSQRGCIGVLDEVFQGNSARAVRPEAVNGGFERDQGVRPIAAWICFRERSADGAPVSHLHVGNSGGTVVQDGNVFRKRGVLNLGVAGHCSKAKCSQIFFNEGSVRDEVQIHQVFGIGEAKLKQRNQTLAAGEKLRAFAELAKHGDRFFQRSRPVIVK